MPIIDKFKDMGTVVMGKVESGSVREGDALMVMPNKVFSHSILPPAPFSGMYAFFMFMKFLIFFYGD